MEKCRDNVRSWISDVGIINNLNDVILKSHHEIFALKLKSHNIAII